MARHSYDADLELQHIYIEVHAERYHHLTVLVLQTFNGGFGADPVKDIEHFTGKAALNTLFITMLISPIAMYLLNGTK